MRIDNINIADLIDNNKLTINEDNKEAKGNFGTIFNSAVRLLDATSLAEHEAQQIQMDYISGKTDDMLAVILAEQRAQTAVAFTSQVISSVMDSYKQIMNLQV